MKTLLLTLLSPELTTEAISVQKVSFPGEIGSFTVLPQHAPMIATLAEGDIVYSTDGAAEERVHIKSGVMEVCKDKVSVCFER